MVTCVSEAVSAAFDPKAWAAGTIASWQRYRWPPPSPRVQVAVSGGMDSVALLHFWRHHAVPRWGGSLRALHVDHGWRRDSHLDREFVGELCAKWAIPFRAIRLDPVSRRRGTSLEAWGRLERYRAFASAGEEAAVDWTLTAHHREDQLETLLYRLGRGTGLEGLRGIRFCREDGVVRPFLNRSRWDIRAYCRAYDLLWREDESNCDLRFDRNRIRHVVLPRWHADTRAEAASAQRIAQTVGLLAPKLRARMSGSVSVDSLGRPRISLDQVAGEVKSGGEWLFTMLSEVVGRAGGRWTARTHREFLRRWPNGGLNFDMGTRLRLEARDGYLVASPAPPPPAKRARSDWGQWKFPARPGHYAGWVGGSPCRLEIKRYAKSVDFDPRPTSPWKAFLDSDRISCTLWVRTRSPGDVFSPLGTAAPMRKLKKFYNGLKISRTLRDRWPLVCRGAEVVWAPGLAVSDLYKVSAGTTEILELEMAWQNP